MAPSSTPANVQALLPKLTDADADLRYMSLSDLHKVLNNGAPGFLIGDHMTCTKTVEGLLKSLVGAFRSIPFLISIGFGAQDSFSNVSNESTSNL